MLIGAPSLEIEEAKLSKDYSIYPSDFHGVYPKLIVKENDSVKAGEALFFDKNSERVKFVSPVSGKIKEIVRGDRRKVLEIKIEPDKNISYKKIEKLKSEEPAIIIDFLVENGFLEFSKPSIVDALDKLKDLSIKKVIAIPAMLFACLLYTSPSPRD